MKQLTLISILLTILIGSDEHFNPNGNPFSLNISAKIENSKAFSESDGMVLEMKMPINNWITLIGGFNRDRYKNIAKGLEDWDNNEFENSDEKLNYSEAFEVIHYGIEAHIPIYKLWK